MIIPECSKLAHIRCSMPGVPFIAKGNQITIVLYVIKKMYANGKRYQYIYFIGGRRWRNTRAVKLKETPYCERCAERGLMVPAVLVHHIIPVQSGKDKRQMRSLSYRPKNLQSLCHKCHVEIHKEMRRQQKMEGLGTTAINEDKLNLH